MSDTVSPEQLAATRANSAKSTGPRTKNGKTHSAQNARQYRRAIEEFERLKALREELRNEPNFPEPEQTETTCTACETNPILPENPAPVPAPPAPAPGPWPLAPDPRPPAPAPCPRRFSVTMKHEAIFGGSDPGACLVGPERAGL
jgi:hypothetical protein